MGDGRGCVPEGWRRRWNINDFARGAEQRALYLPVVASGKDTSTSLSYKNVFMRCARGMENIVLRNIPRPKRWDNLAICGRPGNQRFSSIFHDKFRLVVKIVLWTFCHFFHFHIYFSTSLQHFSHDMCARVQNYVYKSERYLWKDQLSRARSGWHRELQMTRTLKGSSFREST